MSTFVRPISKELQEVANNELNETPTRTREDLKYIKEWLQKQPHLKCRMDDQWLTSFLRGCKFSLERTKQRIDNFYTMRDHLPELFTNRDPFRKEIQEVLNYGVMLPLPSRANYTGPKINLISWNNVNSDTISVIDVIKVVFMIFDILLVEDDNFSISGVWTWCDCKEYHLKYMLQMTPAFVKKAAICGQDGYPTRNKAMHCINSPVALESLLNILKSVVSSKIKDRIHVYSEKNYEKFQQSIPLSHLPKEYGGENGSIENIKMYWKKKVESYKDWFLEDSKFSVDESLRPIKPKTSAEIFGIEGTFRKLVID